MAAIWSFRVKTEVAPNHVMVGPLAAHHLDCSIGSESVCMCLCEVNAFGESNLKKITRIRYENHPKCPAPLSWP